VPSFPAYLPDLTHTQNWHFFNQGSPEGFLPILSPLPPSLSVQAPIRNSSLCQWHAGFEALRQEVKKIPF